MHTYDLLLKKGFFLLRERFAVFHASGSQYFPELHLIWTLQHLGALTAENIRANSSNVAYSGNLAALMEKFDDEVI